MTKKEKLEKKDNKVIKGDKNSEYADSIKELNENIEKLNKGFENYFSFKRNFAKGIVSGVATALGASIVAGLLLTILSRTINSVEDVPIINDIIRTTNLKEIIENNDNDDN